MSTLTKRDIPNSFIEAKHLLGQRDQRRISTNGWLLNRGEQEIALKLHNTIIVRFMGDGRIIISHGGWPSVTTKSWMNAALRTSDFRVFTERGVFSIGHYGDLPDGSRGMNSVRVFGRVPVTLKPWVWSWSFSEVA